MTKESKGRFSEKGKSILQTGPPKNIGDLLPDQEGIRQDVNTTGRKYGNTKGRTPVNTEETKKPRVRHELQLSYDLSEKLRKYVFKNRTTKTAVIGKALVMFLDQEKK